MRKRIFALLFLSVLFCMILTGCAAEQDSKESATTEDTPSVVTTDNIAEEIVNSAATTENNDNNVVIDAVTDGISVETAYNDMLSGSEHLSITNNGYEFKDYPISDSSVVKIGGELTVNQGAMYEEVGAGLSLYCDFGLTQTLDELFFRVLIGTDSEPENWSELAHELNEFIFTDGIDKEIISKLETLDCVSGTFDYEARKYEFVIADLDKAVSELHITNEMFGYVLAKLNEFPSEIAFDGNSVSVSLEVKTYG